MEKPADLSTTLASQGTTAQASIINQLFAKLEEIRQYHVEGTNSGSGFTTEPDAFNTNFVAQGGIANTNYPTKIKEYFTILEESKFVTFESGEEKYSEEIYIPSVGELITATDFRDYIYLVNDLLTKEVNDANYWSCPDCGCDGACGLNCVICSCDGYCYATSG